jgi:hypothetical protein
LFEGASFHLSDKVRDSEFTIDRAAAAALVAFASPTSVAIPASVGLFPFGAE